MCLIIRKNAKAKTAKKDIVCYKVLVKWINPFLTREFIEIFETPFFKMPVHIGDEYGDVNLKTSICNVFPREEWGVDDGYHSLETFEDAADYVSRLMCCNRQNYVIVKCIIPKGTKYYQGKNYFRGHIFKGYASDRIKYMEEVFCEENLIKNNFEKIEWE